MDMRPGERFPQQPANPNDPFGPPPPQPGPVYQLPPVGPDPRYTQPQQPQQHHAHPIQQPYAPQQPYPQPIQQPAAYRPPPNNSPATTGMILGIISLVLYFVPIAGTILPIIGLRKSIAGRKLAEEQLAGHGRGMAIAGYVMSIIGIILSVLGLLYWAFFIAVFSHEYPVAP